MLDAIRRFFESRLSATGSAAAQNPRHRLQLATAALLLEVARADFDTHHVELAAVQRAISRTFQLSEAEVQELLRLAEDEVREATSDYAFTSLINSVFDAAAKILVVARVWETTYADGALDKQEEHLIRRIAEPIYVPNSTIIADKIRVAERQGRGS